MTRTLPVRGDADCVVAHVGETASGPAAGTCARPQEPGPDANACRDGECREPRIVEGASLTGEDEGREQGGQRAA
jgi:hypothetical protein